jgi:ribonuclease VapC
VIVLDTSALVAVLQKEPDHLLFAAAMDEADRCIVSAVTVYEASVVMLGKGGQAGIDALRRLLVTLDVEVVPFADTDTILATAAYARFGKGRRNDAKLNICDCAAYALAKARGLPLLFKGEDFAATDIVSSL